MFHDERIAIKIHSDQGACLEYEILGELRNLTGMTKTRTTPYHATRNAVPVILNITLLEILGILESD